jgi:glycosyltransferase involved in cell wall biosynthesis
MTEASAIPGPVPDQNSDCPLPPVSIVIIGRNEAGNLPECIASVRKADYPPDLLEVMYIDTDSDDGSPAVARSLGVTVHEEHSDFPTPGRAFNRGWREAQHALVHFLGGDMTLKPGYLAAAIQALQAEDLVCVFGRVVEKETAHNQIARLLDYPWRARQPGLYPYPAGGGTFRKDALTAVGGYNPEMLRGEETELGLRLTHAGGCIRMLAAEMAGHDFGVHTFADVWEWFASKGRAMARLEQLPPSEYLATDQAAARRNWLQMSLAAAISIFILAVSLFQPAIVLLFPAGLALMCVYVSLRYLQPDELRPLRIGFMLLQYLFKPAVWAGMIHQRFK